MVVRSRCGLNVVFMVVLFAGSASAFGMLPESVTNIKQALMTTIQGLAGQLFSMFGLSARQSQTESATVAPFSLGSPIRQRQQPPAVARQVQVPTFRPFQAPSPNQVTFTTAKPFNTNFQLRSNSTQAEPLARNTDVDFEYEIKRLNGLLNQNQ